jgi:NADH:ubiquinone oxidoreductase subunit 2 (subunit N)
MVRQIAFVVVLMLSCLALGASGYHFFEDLSWLDATLNATMLLAGMGPMDVPVTTGGKLFCIFYALFSGIAFLTIVAVLLAPVAHRFLHRFHLDVYDDAATS